MSTSNNVSAVNDQITDAVSQMNALVLGGSPSEAIAMLDVTSAETFGMSMHNAVSAQQNSQISSSAAVTSTCAKMLQTQVPVAVQPTQPERDLPPFLPLNVDGLKDKNDEELKKIVAALQGYLNKQDSDQANDSKVAETADKTVKPAEEPTSSTEPKPTDTQGADSPGKKP